MGMIASMLRVNETDLNNFLENSSLLEDRFYSEEEFEDESEILDLDKSWDGILYLLSPEDRYAGRMSKVIFSAKFIDEAQDFGYGPAHYLKPADVLELNGLLSDINPEDLAKNYSADKMNEAGVYPSWDEDEENKTFLVDSFREIRAFYSKAAANNQGIISILS